MLGGKLNSDDRRTVWLATLDTLTHRKTQEVHINQSPGSVSLHVVTVWCVQHTHRLWLSVPLRGFGYISDLLSSQMDKDTCTINTLILAQVFITHHILSYRTFYYAHFETKIIFFFQYRQTLCLYKT